MTIKNIIKKRFKFRFNRYLLISSIFLIWIFFFDGKSIVNLIELKKEISELEKEKSYYKKKIDDDRKKIKELKTNKSNLEKFAREQYYMKNKNEDIYIFNKKN